MPSTAKGAVPLRMLEQQTNKEEVSIPGRPVCQTVLRITALPFIENESSAVNGIGGGGGKAAVGQGILWSRRRRRKSNSICVGKGGEEEGKLPLFLLLSFPPPSSSSFGGGGGSPLFRLIVVGKREIYFPWGEGLLTGFSPLPSLLLAQREKSPPPPFFAKPFSLSFIWGIDCGRAYH